MTAFVTTFVPIAPVYPLGTINVAYPYGTVQLTFGDPLPAVLILNNNDRYEEEQDELDITYGASFITITNKTGSLWPVGTRGLLQVETPEIEGGGIGPPGPPGADSGSVDGILALRALAPIAGKTLRLNYHTTPGDLGGGEFYGVTTGGPYTDNGGTVIVPTGGDGSAAWLRVWDHVKAHVGWFGAACTPMDLASDDYIPVTKCLGLFTNGRNSAAGLTGIVDVGPGFCFSQPLIYGGVGEAGFKLVGRHSNARGGQEKSLLRYTGPETLASIIFYGANEWSIEDINTYPNLALSGVLVTADNTYNHTSTHAITAGAGVIVTPSGATAADKVFWLQPGVALGVDAGGPNFEIVYITAVNSTTGTFTATFTKNHASGIQLGGGAPCSSGWINRCRLMCPSSPVWTTLALNATGASPKTFTVADVTDIRVGESVRVGSLLYAEILHPLSVNVGANSFTATSSFDHPEGAIVMRPTSGISFGNRLLGTVQVDNVVISDTFFVGSTPDRSYTGFRQVWGGNVKIFMFNNCFATYMRTGFSCEQSSGQYVFNGGTSAGLLEMIWHNLSSTLAVHGWEDEGAAMWLTGLGGSNPSQATFVGCTMQGEAPYGMVEATTDEMFIFSGQLTFIGCHLRNGRDSTSLPIITSSGVTQGNLPAGLAIINCTIANATLANMNFVWAIPGNSSPDVLKDGTGNVTMLNCIGNMVGVNVQLPNVIPPLKMWQGTATYDPASIAAGAVAAAQTMTVNGAALGDLVEASFSLDLQGIGINAWVSAADTVKYQFRNPTAAPIDLASGTVKCRVKK